MKIELESSKDQHLLKNEKILKEEVDAAKISRRDKVIEIGAGTGILTEELCKKAEVVFAFEIDKKFAAFFENLEEKYDNLEVIFEDAMNHNWKGFDKLVSNIPYSASEPILMKAIKSEIKLLVLIVGENFKEILLSDSKVGVISNLFYKITPIKKVSRENFDPVPRVDSWIVKLELKNLDKTSRVNKILRRTVMKDGKIKNALLFSMVENGFTKNEAREIISKLKINENILDKPIEKITGKFLANLSVLLSETIH